MESSEIICFKSLFLKEWKPYLNHLLTADELDATAKEAIKSGIGFCASSVGLGATHRQAKKAKRKWKKQRATSAICDRFLLPIKNDQLFGLNKITEAIIAIQEAFSDCFGPLINTLSMQIDGVPKFARKVVAAFAKSFPSQDKHCPNVASLTTHLIQLAIQKAKPMHLRLNTGKTKQIQLSKLNVVLDDVRFLSPDGNKNDPPPLCFSDKALTYEYKCDPNYQQEYNAREEVRAHVQHMAPKKSRLQRAWGFTFPAPPVSGRGIAVTGGALAVCVPFGGTIIVDGLVAGAGLSNS